MTQDEVQIRELVSSWQVASRAGDVPAVLALMTDDVVFQVVGREPFGKQEFAALSAVPPGAARPRIDATQRIDEIQVSGDIAFMRAFIAVTVTPPDGSTPMERAGYTLTIFRKIDDRWLLARDANLMVPKPRDEKAQG